MPLVPKLLFGLRLWAAICLALYVAYRLELDNAYWAGTSAAIVCRPSVGASPRRGSFRMIGMIVGAVSFVVLTACVAQDRVAFLLSIALWGDALRVHSRSRISHINDHAARRFSNERQCK
jgi:uncharacterized membrane protein YccC